MSGIESLSFSRTRLIQNGALRSGHVTRKEVTPENGRLSFLKDLGISSPYPMPMHCDNQAAIFIARNSIFPERTKHIEIDCHYIQDKVMFTVISTPHVTSSHQLADAFTKSLGMIS